MSSALGAPYQVVVSSTSFRPWSPDVGSLDARTDPWMMTPWSGLGHSLERRRTPLLHISHGACFWQLPYVHSCHFPTGQKYTCQTTTETIPYVTMGTETMGTETMGTETTGQRPWGQRIAALAQVELLYKKLPNTKPGGLIGAVSRTESPNTPSLGLESTQILAPTTLDFGG